ncbi:MAG: diacylglycerol kinase family protein [Myxococcota bacterium]|nr:diacylglycerol kinase family protein [Myxococcota bacterium]
MSARIGVLVNARAGAAKHDPSFIERVEGLLPAGRVRATWSAEEIGPALHELREQGVGLLILVGGDGTVGGTLTELLEGWPSDTRPAVALAPGGTVNTIARSLGARRDAERTVRDLVESGGRRSSLRPLVRVRSESGETRSGMIFVQGAAVKFLQRYYQSSLGVGGAASTTARILGSTIVGGELAHAVFDPAPVEIEVDGTPLDYERFTVLGAATVRHVGLGFKPFQTAGTDPLRFHFLISDAGPSRLALELPAFRLGLSMHGSCLRHFPARRVSLRFPEPQAWSVDADFHEPARALEVEATEPLRFVEPG